MSEDEEEGYIVEYTSLGKALKVTAIDIATMKEVSIVASPKATQKALADLAIRKLKYVMKRDKKS